MISSSKTYPGVYYTKSTDKLGNIIESINPNVVAERVDLAVSNGNVKGNHKSPNPFYFGKTVSTDMVWSQFQERSGVPGRTKFQLHTESAGGDWDMSQGGGLYSSRFEWAPMEDQALKRIFEQMRYGSGNLVVDLAEARETIQMIRNAFSVRKMAREFMQNVVNPRKYRGGRRLAYATNKWLEYRYGWLPFVSSTYELLKTLSKKVNEATTVKLTGRGTWADEFNVIKRGTAIGPFVDMRHVEQSARVLLAARMRGRTTMEIYDFTSLNPAGIAWELVPLSFVADWFVNVGETLSLWEDHILFANRFIDGFKTRTYKETVVRTYEESWSGEPPRWPSGLEQDDFLTYYSDSKRARRERRSKDRTVLLALPTPGGLRIDVKLNAKRLLDAASLIRGVFGKTR